MKNRERLELFLERADQLRASSMFVKADKLVFEFKYDREKGTSFTRRWGRRLVPVETAANP
jgi:hypothetical protein